jgi:hypothetical protein
MKSSREDLIIVPCHGVFTGTDPLDPCDWVIEKWQEHDLCHFIAHVQTGLDLFIGRAGIESLGTMRHIMFSGGRTKQETEQSEALGYYKIASIILKDSEWSDKYREAILEEYARDSFENVLFCICRFWQLYARFPTHIHIVGFPFKKRRFKFLHFPAINQLLLSVSNDLDSIINGFIPINFEYHSVHLNSPNSESWIQDDDDIAEKDTAFPLFKLCPYGNGGPLLEKKRSRTRDLPDIGNTSHPGSLKAIPYGCLFPESWKFLFIL